MRLIIGKEIHASNCFDTLYCIQLFTYAAELENKGLLNKKGVIKYPLSKKDFQTLGIDDEHGLSKSESDIIKECIWYTKKNFDKKRGRLLMDMSKAYYKKTLKIRKELTKYPENNKELNREFKIIEQEFINSFNNKEMYFKYFAKHNRCAITFHYDPGLSKNKNEFYVWLVTRQMKLYEKRKAYKRSDPDPIINCMYKSYTDPVYLVPTKPMIRAIVETFRKNKYIPEDYIKEKANKEMEKIFDNSPVTYYKKLIAYVSAKVGEAEKDLDRCGNYYLTDPLLKKLEMIDKNGNMKSLKKLIAGKFGKLWKKYDSKFMDKLY